MFQLDIPAPGMRQIKPSESCPDQHTYSIISYQRSGPISIGTFCRNGTISQIQVLYRGRVSLEVSKGTPLNPSDFSVSIGPISTGSRDFEGELFVYCLVISHSVHLKRLFWLKLAEVTLKMNTNQMMSGFLIYDNHDRHKCTFLNKLSIIHHPSINQSIHPNLFHPSIPASIYLPIHVSIYLPITPSQFQIEFLEMHITNQQEYIIKEHDILYLI